MLALVKMPRTKSTLFEIKGNIPQRILNYLKKDYTVELENDDDEEYVNITETDWYKNIKASMIPGDHMKIYRENAELSQAELGEKLGGVSRHKISDYENGRRTIGIELAKKLSKVFNRPVETFI